MRALAGKKGDFYAATLLDDLAADYDRLAARAVPCVTRLPPAGISNFESGQF